jgi:serine/threonine-protein kinase
VESTATLAIGTVLGGAYRLTRVIGAGGMGGVYEAVQLATRKRVAVKVMSSELAKHPEGSARFGREVKLTSQLDHPHIVRVIDHGTSPTGEPYLVMEYLEGEDLDQRLARESRLPSQIAVEIVNQVAAALDVAHKAGIVHRDLKPANVFLPRAADGAVFVKVVDFGISKSLKKSATLLTRAKSLVVGTPEYMAPEQAAGKVREIDHRIDQWSLACIAWQMLSGYQPFNNPDVNALLYQIMYQEPTPLGPYAGLIPPAVGAVLHRALSKRREERFPTITAFARAFAAAVAATLDPATIPDLPAPDLRPQPQPQPQGQLQPRKRRSWIWAAAFGVIVAAVAAALFVDPGLLSVLTGKDQPAVKAPGRRHPVRQK